MACETPVRLTRIKRGDTAPAFRATLLDADGEPIDLTGATARFLMRDMRTKATKVAADADIPSPETDGVVSYEWDAADTDTPGAYEAEVQVTFGDGTIRTAPSDGYHRVDVLEDITG